MLYFRASGPHLSQATSHLAHDGFLGLRYHRPLALRDANDGALTPVKGVTEPFLALPGDAT
ncbi:MAG: hypothetical protein LC798_20060, partial [Chloroflexi bacterium]|nr:hypothetical protein [Chloroflexota bacterium]